MPEAKGENVQVAFSCVCCGMPVTLWAFQPKYPGTSNTEPLPKDLQRLYRQRWYLSPDNDTFDKGRLLRLVNWNSIVILTAESFVPDGNPYSSGLPRILEQGTGHDHVLWACQSCDAKSDQDPEYLWHHLRTLSFE